MRILAGLRELLKAIGIELTLVSLAVFVYLRATELGKVRWALPRQVAAVAHVPSSLALAGAGVGVILTLLAIAPRRVRQSRGWVRVRVRSERAALLQMSRKESARFWWRVLSRRIKVGLTHPSMRVLIAAVLLSASASLFLYWRYGRPDQEHRPTGLYAALWSSHVAFAAGALPILIFVIELAQGRRERTDGTVEVLIRESLVFPLLLFIVAGSFAFALEVLNEFWATILLMATFAAVAYSFGRILELLFAPPKARTEACCVTPRAPGRQRS